jgi:CHAD domain-containing protein
MLEKHLEKVLRDRWRTYRRQMRKCRKHPSEKTVHQLRVATRKLMAQFVLLECLLSDPVLARARRLLKRRLETLGPLRDLQVQLLCLERKQTAYPELGYLCDALKKQERSVMEKVGREIKDWKSKKLEKWIMAAADDLSVSARRNAQDPSASKLALRHASEAFQRVIERREAIQLDDLSTIHRTRVAFKRFRYMVESLPQSLTGLTDLQLRAMVQYQRRMGRIQDLEVLKGLLTSSARRRGWKGEGLEAFVRHVDQQLSRAVTTFMRSADALSGFWSRSAERVLP